MTNIIYEKQTINWEQKARYKKQTGIQKIANKKKGSRYGHYVKDPIVKYGTRQHYLRCQAWDLDDYVA